MKCKYNTAVILLAITSPLLYAADDTPKALLQKAVGQDAAQEETVQKEIVQQETVQQNTVTLKPITQTATAQSIELHNSYSMQAFTGVFNTPNASVINYGNFGFSYSNNYYDQGSKYNKTQGFQEAHDLKFGIGLLPGLEVVGRLGTRCWNKHIGIDGPCDNGYTFRDLSGSFKYQLPYIPKNWFSLAVGGQDIGGSVVKSEAYYISASKAFSLSSLGSVRTNVGYAKSDNALDYMNGVFGSVEFQPWHFLQLAAEYDANAVNAGVKLFTPQEWLPTGWQVSAAAQLYSSDDKHNEKDEWFSVNVTIPMGSTSARQSTATLMQKTAQQQVDTGKTAKSSSRIISQQQQQQQQKREIASDKREPKLVADQQALRGVTQAQLRDFSRLLTDYGFESVSIGLDGFIANKLVIEFENNLYNRNEDDAMQVMATLLTEQLYTNATIHLTNFGLTVKSVNLHFDDSRPLALGSYSAAQDSNLVSRWLMNENVDWLVKNQSSSFLVPRLIVSPALASIIGSEYGAFDYQLVMSLNAQVSLWPGALVDFRYMTDTIASSDDFEKGRYIYNRFGIRKGIDRRLFHQAFSLPLNVFTQFSYGRVYGSADGLLNETRWHSDNGLHRVSLLAGDFEQKISGTTNNVIKRKPLLAKYRYRYAPLNWDLELTAGQYWRGDKGFTVRSLHWFDNVQVGLKYRRTKFDAIDGGEEEDFVAIGFSIPLNFKKSMTPNYGFQVKGIEQWNYYVETSLTDKNTGNHIKTGFGEEPSLYNNLNQAYFNRDRY